MHTIWWEPYSWSNVATLHTTFIVPPVWTPPKSMGKRAAAMARNTVSAPAQEQRRLATLTGKFRHSWLVETTTQLHHWRTHYTPTLSPSVPLHFRTPGRFGNFGLGPLGPLGPRTSVIPQKDQQLNPPQNGTVIPLNTPVTFTNKSNITLLNVAGREIHRTDQDWLPEGISQYIIPVVPHKAVAEVSKIGNL